MFYYKLIRKQYIRYSLLNAARDVFALASQYFDIFNPSPIQTICKLHEDNVEYVCIFCFDLHNMAFR